MMSNTKDNLTLILSMFLVLSGVILIYRNGQNLFSAIILFVGILIIFFYILQKQKKAQIIVGDFFNHLKQNEKSLNSIFEKLTFFDIFLIWASIITLFGFFYYYFETNTHYLMYTQSQTIVNNLKDTIYYSFIAATSTGFGDIVPIGLFKVVSIFEVVTGLVLLAFLTSKLVSIKQNIILTELYDLSFNQEMSRIRKSLLVFRENITRYCFNKIVNEKNIEILNTQINSLEHTLSEIAPFFQKEQKSDFTKIMDALGTEILLNNINQSFEKLEETLMFVKKKNSRLLSTKLSHKLLNECFVLNEKIYEGLSLNTQLDKETLEQLITHKNKTIENIKNMFAS